MKLLFLVMLLIFGFGGGILIVNKYRDNDPRFSISFLFLLVIYGLITFLAGLYFHVTGTILFSWKGGVKYGGQLMVVGILLVAVSLFYAIRAIRKQNFVNKNDT
jgi:hypothetical protein